MKLTIKYTRFSLMDVLVLFYLLYGIGASNGPEYRYILMAVAFLWMILLLATRYPHQFNLTQNKAAILYFDFLLGYISFIPLGNNFTLTFKYLGTYSLYFVLLLMFDYYHHERRLEILSNIGMVLLYWIIFLCIISLALYQMVPLAARLMASGELDTGRYILGGGYHLAMLCGQILPVFVYHFFKRRYNRSEIIMSIIMMALILQTQSAITTLATLAGCAISFLLVRSNGNMKPVLRFMLIAVIALLALRQVVGSAILGIVGDLDSIDFSNVLKGRIYEIGCVLSNRPLPPYSAMGLRIQNYTRPLKNQNTNIFLGGILTYGVLPSTELSTDSAVIRTFTAWGLLIGGCYLGASVAKLKSYSHLLGSVFVCVMLLCLNPSDEFSFYAGEFFILPWLAILEKESSASNNAEHLCTPASASLPSERKST